MILQMFTGHKLKKQLWSQCHTEAAHKSYAWAPEQHRNAWEKKDKGVGKEKL